MSKSKLELLQELNGQVTEPMGEDFTTYDIVPVKKRTDYQVKLTISAENQTVYNAYERAKYRAIPGTMIATGTRGEQWVIKEEKAAQVYGHEIGSLQEGESRSYNPLESDPLFACKVPEDIKGSFLTAWGTELEYNTVYDQPDMGHNGGDWIIFSNNNGKPNHADKWVVNGEIFVDTYEVVGN